MSHEVGSYSPSRTESEMPSSGSPTATETARREAMGMGQSVKEAGGEVTRTAAGQAKEVADEAGRQARDLLDEARGQVREQVRTGQQKAAENLSAVAEELREMADKSGESGIGAELARQASARVHDLASWLEQRQPGDLLDEVRNWARRRPGAFLAAAAAAGAVAGRVTGGTIAARSTSGADSSAAGSLPESSLPESAAAGGENVRDEPEPGMVPPQRSTSPPVTGPVESPMAPSAPGLGEGPGPVYRPGGRVEP